jgi:hypothetical protein
MDIKSKIHHHAHTRSNEKAHQDVCITQHRRNQYKSAQATYTYLLASTIWYGTVWYHTFAMTHHDMVQYLQSLYGMEWYGVAWYGRYV